MLEMDAEIEGSPMLHCSQYSEGCVFPVDNLFTHTKVQPDISYVLKGRNYLKIPAIFYYSIYY